MRRMTRTVILYPWLVVVLAPAPLPAQQAVTHFTLIDANSNQPIAGFDPLTDGAVLNLPELPTRSLNVRANTSPPTVGSVRFVLDGTPVITENVAPYALAGDTSGNYNSWTPGLGMHTLTATPYTQSNAGGTAGTALTITFTVTEGPTPTPGGPTPTPPAAPDAWTFVAEDGIVVVEVESAAPAGDWAAETESAGFTGDGYFTWRGPDLFNTPGAGVLTYNLRLDRPATYQLRIRNYHTNPDGTQSNDCFVQMNDGPWLKLWSPEVNQWTWTSSFDLSETDKPPASYTLPAGDHVFRICGRSNGFRIDRFHLYTGLQPGPLDAGRPQSPTVETGSVSGELKKWHRVDVAFSGPDTGENALPNPFLDYRLTVAFTHEGRTLRVPGYYAADGNAAETSADNGTQWRVHFTPDAEGTWHYWASFRAGTGVAVSTDTSAGEPTAFHGQSGTFTVGPTDKTGADLRGKGLLRYVAKHHLQFAETGEYYLKGGADSPENFLGYHEFDGTFDTGGIIDDFLHHYAPHVADWREGDPVWQGNKGKGIVGALNYLGSRRINSVYFLTYNVDGGDGADTWPWTTPVERLRFDCSKLDQWEIVFSHMDRLGIQLHLVTQENENDRVLDGGELGTVRKLYYRELIARFAHHPALQWNLGEENTNTDPQRIAFAGWIRGLDPYDHPIVVHTFYNHADTYYDGLIGQAHFEGTSIQGEATGYNAWAVNLRRRTANAGRPWAIYGDEQGPAVDANLANLDTLRRDALWGNLMGGGAGVEWYFGYQGDFGDMQSEDWRRTEPLWQLTRHALDFFHAHLPFHEMTPDNTLVTGTASPLALAKPDEVYVVYLPAGRAASVTVGEGAYRVGWYNPRSGGELLDGPVRAVLGPGLQSIGEPPAETTQDWVALLAKSQDSSILTTQ